MMSAVFWSNGKIIDHLPNFLWDFLVAQTFSLDHL